MTEDDGKASEYSAGKIERRKMKKKMAKEISAKKVAKEFLPAKRRKPSKRTSPANRQQKMRDQMANVE